MKKGDLLQSAAFLVLALAGLLWGLVAVLLR